MTLSGCAQICKWVVILFNVVLILAGFALFGIGTYLRMTAGGLVTNSFNIAFAVCIVLSSLILLAGCLGDYGSSKENKSCLSSYGSVLTLLVTAFVIGGIVAYVHTDKFVAHVLEFYTVVYSQYVARGDLIRSFILKVFHNMFDCCGVGGILHTLAGATNVCPDQTILGINVSPNCMTVILDIKANSVLFFFLGIAGVLIVPLVCASFLWQQLSRPLLSTPAYTPLSADPRSSTIIQLSPTSTPAYCPPPYSTVTKQDGPEWGV